jgi:hypothetical protein
MAVQRASCMIAAVVTAMASSRDIPPLAVSRMTTPWTTCHATAPITTTFSSDLPASTALVGPNIRFMPWSGLSRESFGRSAFGARWMPPWAADAANPVTSIASAKGATAIAASSIVRRSSTNMPDVSGWVMTRVTSPNRLSALLSVERTTTGRSHVATSSAR